MANAIYDNWVTKGFHHLPMKVMMAYLRTRNTATQILAADANKENIQATGTAPIMINGVIQANVASAAIDVSALTPYAAWATATAYTTVSEVTKTLTDDVTVKHFVCIAAHTSSSDTEPYFGKDWRTYWRELQAWATTGTGDTIATGATKYYLVCVNSAGTYAVFKAYNSSNALQIPVYDPSRWVAIGIWKQAAGTNNPFTVGTTEHDANSGVQTLYQLTGPVFPDYTLLKNSLT